MEPLRVTIQRKINEADLSPGQLTTQVELPGGLRFRIRKLSDRYAVVLSRSGIKPPSEVEFKTFNECWPKGYPRAENIRAAIVYELKG